MSGPTLHQDASRYVAYFEAAILPFVRNDWLPFETRAALLDGILINWVRSQRYLLRDDSPSFHEMLIKEGYLDERN